MVFAEDSTVFLQRNSQRSVPLILPEGVLLDAGQLAFPFAPTSELCATQCVSNGGGLGLEYGSMNGDLLNQFQRDIAPYRSVWKSARLSGLATRHEGQLISLGVRVSLSALPPEPLNIQAPCDWFIYFDGRCPVAHFDRVLEELVNGRYLTVQADYSATGGSYARVYLNRQAAQSLTGVSEEAFQQNRAPNVPLGPTWNYWGFQNRGNFAHYGTDRASFVLSANGERNIDLLSYQDQQRVDSKLRAGDPVFDGLEGLMESLLRGLNSVLHQTDAQFQVVAPLPFFLECPRTTELVVRAPATTPRGGLGVRFFFEPKGFTPSPNQGLQPQDAVACDEGMISWHVGIQWPEGSAAARACLFFLDRQVDSLGVNRWLAGASLRAAFDAYFDPGRRKLAEGLGLETRPSAPVLQARQFEAAVARLMSLLGAPLIWYGDWLAAEARPDLGGLIEVEGKKVAILTECTLAKPEQKFSELHKRADDLTKILGTEAEVMAVVFAPVPTTQSEARRAAEHQIVLVGLDELRRLLNLLQSPEDPSGVLRLLQELRNMASSLIPGPWDG